MPPDLTPLQAIQRKEQSVARRLQAAQAAADARIAAVQQEAEAMKQRAQARGQEAARQRFEAGMAKARADAGQIVEAGQASAAQLEQQSAGYLVETSRRIVRFVLPHNHGGGRRSGTGG